MYLFILCGNEDYYYYYYYYYSTKVCVNVTRDLGRNNVLFGTQLAAIKVQTTLDLSFLNGKQTKNNIQTLTAKNWV